jgi:hypothetical protein
MCKHKAEIFLVGDRGYGRVNRPVGGQSAIGNQKNVCAKPFHRRWRLWALNDRRGDSGCAAHVWRTPNQTVWPGPSREDSGSAGVDEQGIRRFAE